jgi:hypothetical protein
LVFGHFELVVKVVLADSQTGVDSTSFGGLKCFGGDFDIFLSGSGETAYGDAFEFGGKGMHALEVTGGGDGEAGFDDVDSEAD